MTDVRHDTADGITDELERRTALEYSSHIDVTTCHRLNAYPVLVATASRDASMHATHQPVAKFRNPQLHRMRRLLFLLVLASCLRLRRTPELLLAVLSLFACAHVQSVFCALP